LRLVKRLIAISTPKMGLKNGVFSFWKTKIKVFFFLISLSPLKVKENDSSAEGKNDGRWKVTSTQSRPGQGGWEGKYA